jgi:putative iron-dependent peroxidase
MAGVPSADCLIMSQPQPAILAPLAPHARYLEFTRALDGDPLPALRDLAAREIDAEAVVGLGPGLLRGLGRDIEGLRAFPALSGPGLELPSTQTDLWCWIRGEDRGEIHHRARAFQRTMAPAFRRARAVDGFVHAGGRDLTGYEDGTDNPEGETARAAAILASVGAGRDGSSFVAVQQWRHDLDHFDSLAVGAQDDIIGRRKESNEEFDEAPASAHVKRTAQESFSPEAFVLRRSMPWTGSHGAGLMFVAFGHSLEAFEAQLRRMAGLEDGIADGLFRFTRPLTGSYFWCPPVAGGKLDLRALGL